MTKPLNILMLVLALCASFQLAADEAGAKAAIFSSMHKILPGLTPDAINPSPVDGVYEVVAGSRVFYVSADGNYLFQGNLFDIRQRVDLSEERMKTLRVNSINTIGEDNMVVFAAAKPRHTVTVFTDVDCTYCRKLHNEMDQYHKNGISVRYLMYPRSGVGSPSYLKAVSVMCDDDSKQALTRAKAGENLATRNCDNPVDKHMLLGQDMGLRGTPAIITEDGEMLPGYVPADKLAQALDGDS